MGSFIVGWTRVGFGGVLVVFFWFILGGFWVWCPGVSFFFWVVCGGFLWVWGWFFLGLWEWLFLVVVGGGGVAVGVGFWGWFSMRGALTNLEMVTEPSWLPLFFLPRNPYK